MLRVMVGSCLECLTLLTTAVHMIETMLEIYAKRGGGGRKPRLILVLSQCI